jgi:DNA-binding PadR family transcriptional regulator
MGGHRNAALLSRIEEILLLTVWELGPEVAYGVPIRERVQRVLGRRMSIGAIYVPLERMVERGWLRAAAGEPTPVRGGRRKRYYRVTARGLRALRETRQMTERAWSALSDAEWKTRRA